MNKRKKLKNIFSSCKKSIRPEQVDTCRDDILHVTEE